MCTIMVEKEAPWTIQIGQGTKNHIKVIGINKKLVKFGMVVWNTLDLRVLYGGCGKCGG